MHFPALRYEPYETTESVPNVVVDGSPNAATVLTLTHWPGIAVAAELSLAVAADLSAQMAFRYVESGGSLHGSAQVVTNNHFDQDGLVSAYAMTRPDDGMTRRALLEDLAAAGDFATYRDRRAARLSMVISAYADPGRSPLAPLPEGPAERVALLYAELLDRLPDLVDHLDDHRRLWQDEDRQLSDAEGALARGAVMVEEHPEVDLAVVRMDESVAVTSGHRFAFRRFEGLHPMALHNATDRFAVLLLRGRHYRFTYRYETWVQYRSHRPRPRVDLGPLAEELTAHEHGGIAWRADRVSDLTPQLEPLDGAESSIAPDDLVRLIVRHLGRATSAWDPYDTSSADEVPGT